MPLDDPLALCTAANLPQARLLCSLLEQSGIRARVVEEVVPGEEPAGGLLPAILQPRLYVDRSLVHRAQQVLLAHARQAVDRRANPPANGPIVIACEECGESSAFPGSTWGSVQTCPHCQAFMDIGEPDDLEGWETPEDVPGLAGPHESAPD